jgi:phosphoglycerate dehydrogenase-like enzyme
MRVVFHGVSASAFSAGFAELVDAPLEIVDVPDDLITDEHRQAYSSADVVVGFRLSRSMPASERLTLFQVPGAGYDAVDVTALPPSAILCNTFGHEQAIAEYVMTALLLRHVPIIDADRRLRQRDWKYEAGPVASVHEELAGTTIGLLGYGHIGRAIAARAKAFEMIVHVANRSPVQPSGMVDRAFTLDRLAEFWSSADFFVIALPLTGTTCGIVNQAAFAAMRPSAVIVNVGRGPTIDEHALFDALESRRIAGAIIDTWYKYPSPRSPAVYPASLPFHELPNVVMTPHMSGWTNGTVRRRQRTIADNVRRRMRGEPCVNVVWPTPNRSG